MNLGLRVRLVCYSELKTESFQQAETCDGGPRILVHRSMLFVTIAGREPDAFESLKIDLGCAIQRPNPALV